MENTHPEQALTLDMVQQLITDALEKQQEKHFSQRQQELDEKEQALRSEQQLIRAKALLQEKGLPECLAPTLAPLGEKDMLSAVQEWENLFRAAVQQAVEERLQGETPASGVMQDVSRLPDSDYYAQVYPHLI